MCIHSALIPVDSARPNQVRDALLDSIQTLDQMHSLFCVNPGKDFSRNCNLSFAKVTRTILGFGTSTVFGELAEQLCGDPHLPTKNAFIMSRQKILPDAFYVLFRDFMSHFSNFKTMYGYRILASDGSLLSIPDNLKDYNTMVKGKPGTDPYHQFGIEALYDAVSGIYEDFIVNDFNDHSEEASFLALVYRLKNPESSIITADRYYGTLNNIAHLRHIGAHFVLRCKDIDSNGFACGYDLPDSTFDISFHKTIVCSKKLTKDSSLGFQFVQRKGFDFFKDKNVSSHDISFRLVRIDLGDDHYELLVTDLPADKFPPEVISDIYLQRWKIETSFRRLKHLLGTLFFHSYKHDSVLQEVYAKFIMYNFAALLSASVSFPPSPRKKLQRFVNFSRAVSLSRLFLVQCISSSELLRLLRQDPCFVRPDRLVPLRHRLDTQPAEHFNSRAV